MFIFWIFLENSEFSLMSFFLANLFIFRLFPKKIQSFHFSLFQWICLLFDFSRKKSEFSLLHFWIFGEFVYFWTFPGKSQSFEFLVNLFFFLSFPGKIQSFQLLLNSFIFRVFPQNSNFCPSMRFVTKYAILYLTYGQNERYFVIDLDFDSLGLGSFRYS